MDKFKEHFRKHGASDNFLCLFIHCNQGPFIVTSLAQHLVSHHLQEHSQVDHLYEVMKIISQTYLAGKPCSWLPKASWSGQTRALWLVMVAAFGFHLVLQIWTVTSGLMSSPNESSYTKLSRNAIRQAILAAV